MNLDAFQAERRDRWRDLDELTKRARGQATRLPADQIMLLGDGYRAAVADLAYARRRFPSDPVTRQLEQLVARSRALVYATDTRRGTFRDAVEFLSSGYFKAVAERPVPILIGWALLLVPAIAITLFAIGDPEAAKNVFPSLAPIAEPGHRGVQLDGVGQHSGFSIGIFVNNIQVSFLAFAGGLTAGLLTMYTLITNGAILGAVVGLAETGGNLSNSIRLLTAHGVLELSIIVVAAAAGFRIGWAMIAPGHDKRADALVREARRSIQIVLGTMPWFVLAGLVEGFVTGASPLPIAIAVGVLLGGLYWALVWRGYKSVSRERELLRADTP